MNVEVYWFVLLCMMALSLILGLLLGFHLYAKSNCAGDLVIAPGDEDAANYMFLDLERAPEFLEKQETVVLHVRNLSARK